MPLAKHQPDAHAADLFEPLEQRRLFITHGEPTIFPAATPTGPTVVAKDELQRDVGMRLGADGEWVVRSYAAATEEADRFTVFTDPKDGEAYVITSGDLTLPDGDIAAVLLYRQLPDGTLTGEQVIYANRDQAIREGMVAFVSSDNRVHVAGLNEDGGVVMFYQTGAQNADGTWAWGADNLSQNHFFPQNIIPPVWSSAPTAYVTPWGGLNIAVIDEDGQLQVMWWAPGKRYWSADNLSVIADLPVLNNLRAPTSYVTPWGGQNVAALTRSNTVCVAWWAPATDVWTETNLTDESDGLPLDSVTAYVTPWGGLNIAGEEYETRRPVVYWWTPGMAEWVCERLEFEGGEDPTTYGLRALVQGSEFNLFGYDTEEGDVLRMSWRPGDTDWRLENLTELT